MNSIMFLYGVEIHKFKAKDFKINAVLLCLGNNLKGFLAAIKKRLDFTDMPMVFQFIMIILILLIFWILINI